MSSNYYIWRIRIIYYYSIYILLLLFIIMVIAHNLTSISNFFETVTYWKELFKKVKYHNISVANNSKYF